MDYSKKIISSLLLFHVFAQTKACKLALGTVTCEGKDILDLRSALAALQGKSVNEVIVKNTALKAIEANTCTRAYKEIWIYDNKQLESIDPSAFYPSVPSLYIANCPLDDRVWEFVKNKSAVKELFLKNMFLTKVPADAFKKMPSLTALTFSTNFITTFAAPLSGRKLKLLDLPYNNLSYNSFSNDVFKNASITKLNLQHNPDMRQLDEDTFGDLLDAGTVVHVGLVIPGADNYMQCVGVRWLCAKDPAGAYMYREKVIGYYCKETKFETIFHYCDAFWESRRTGSLIVV